MTISSANVKASEKVARPMGAAITPSLNSMMSRPLMMFSAMPMMNAPTTAPGMEPMPPNTAATKALRPGIAPEVWMTVV